MQLLMLIFTSFGALYKSSADEQKAMLFRIPTDEGVASQILQLQGLCEHLEKTHAAPTQVVITPFRSSHYRNAGDVIFCQHFNISGCYQHTFSCTDRAVERIIAENRCVVNHAVMSDRSNRKESFWFKNLKPHLEKRVKPVALRKDGKSFPIWTNCIVGSLYFSDRSNVPSLRPKLTIQQRYLDAADNFTSRWTNETKFDVVHWRRDDQQRERCAFRDEHTYDFSVNCEGLLVFLRVVENLRRAFERPIYVATNEVDKRIFDVFQRFHFLTIRDFPAQALSPSRSGALTSIEATMVELALMVRAERLWGAGLSFIHPLVGEMRTRMGKFDWEQIPGVNNMLIGLDRDGDRNRRGAHFVIKEMLLRLDTRATGSNLNVALLSYHASEIGSGKLHKFFLNMKVLSERGLKPTFILVAYSEVSESDKRWIIEELKTLDLYRQFDSISFHELGFVESANRKQGVYSAFEGPNIVYYHSLNILFMLPGVSSALLLEPDVKFIKDYWFDDLASRVSSESFWVYGAIYKGKMPLDQSYADHINGVAVYNVGNSGFVDFVSLCKSYHIMDEGLHKGEFRNYDTVWSLMKVYFLERYKSSKELGEIKRKIQLIDGNIIRTDSIVNLSPQVDIDVPIEKVMEDNPSAVLLHQKWAKNADGKYDRI